MAVKAAFLDRYSFQRILFYWRRYFRFFPSCFYTIFAISSYGTSDMPRTKSSSAVSQGHFVLVSMILGYNPSRLGPWVPMNKWEWPTNCWAPQQLLKTLLSDLLVGEEGFGNTQPLLWLVQLSLFINVGVSLSAQETYRSTRHSSEFIHNAFLPFGYPKRAFNDLHLRDHLISMVC